jgi:hypothetical protein
MSEFRRFGIRHTTPEEHFNAAASEQREFSNVSFEEDHRETQA